jgi:hypothetical protein
MLPVGDATLKPSENKVAARQIRVWQKLLFIGCHGSMACGEAEVIAVGCYSFQENALF